MHTAQAAALPSRSECEDCKGRGTIIETPDSGTYVSRPADPEDRGAVPCYHCAETTAEKLARRTPCHPECPGWVVSYSDTYGISLERCDDCAAGVGVTDDDIRDIPEARAAFRRALADSPETRFILTNGETDSVMLCGKHMSERLGTAWLSADQWVEAADDEDERDCAECAGDL